MCLISCSGLLKWFFGHVLGIKYLSFIHINDIYIITSRAAKGIFKRWLKMTLTLTLGISMKQRSSIRIWPSHSVMLCQFHFVGLKTVWATSESVGSPLYHFRIYRRHYSPGNGDPNVKRYGRVSYNLLCPVAFRAQQPEHFSNAVPRLTPFSREELWKQ